MTSEPRLYFDTLLSLKKIFLHFVGTFYILGEHCHGPKLKEYNIIRSTIPLSKIKEFSIVLLNKSLKPL